MLRFLPTIFVGLAATCSIACSDASVTSNCVKTTVYEDSDGDGWGVDDSFEEQCLTPTDHPEGFARERGDCDDDSATVYPGAEELCNGVDDDCNGEVDNGAEGDGEWWPDADGDGYGDPSAESRSCADDGLVDNAEDCDDGDAAVSPDGTEVCNDIDDDCNGEVDDGVGESWYTDADDDGHGDPEAEVRVCEGDDTTGLSELDDDCDDSEPTVSPTQAEICDGLDNNCDETVDEGFIDSDADGLADCVDACPVYADPMLTENGHGDYDSPYMSINDAIDLRGEYCDEILLYPGTYSESVDYGSADLSISSTDGAESTIIEVTSGSGVTMGSGRTSAALLEGVTVRGMGTYTRGVHVGGGSPVIRDCILEDMRIHAGAGASLQSFTGEFTGNIVRNNETTSTGTWQGSGLLVRGGPALIEGNRFEDNTATNTDGGCSEGAGVLAVAETGRIEIASNVFVGNVASCTSAIRTTNGDVDLVNNLVVDNEGPRTIAARDGVSGGSARVRLHNNTISDNDGDALSGFPSDAPNITATNNIIVGNDVGLEVNDSSATIRWENNLVWGNSTDYSDVSDPTGTDGNLSADPVFVGSGDYGLSSGSPAVDAGQDLSSSGVTDDIEGTARPVGGGFDLGAYESH